MRIGYVYMYFVFCTCIAQNQRVSLTDGHELELKQSRLWTFLLRIPPFVSS